jgi:hypothetical protein
MHTGTKPSENVDRWAVGCNSVVLKMACSQSHCKIQAPFPATPCGQWACHFILNEGVRNSALALD